MQDNILLHRSRLRSVALVQGVIDGIRRGRWSSGAKLPSEADLSAEFAVSRSVVREALSYLQAAGVVKTIHGNGSFVIGLRQDHSFHISPAQITTLAEVVAVLELRAAFETEGAALAAQRRTDMQLTVMQAELAAFNVAVERGLDAAENDFKFHLEVARATQNVRFVELVKSLGASLVPRSQLKISSPLAQADRSYLRAVNNEHEGILAAIRRQDMEGARAAMRMHLINSRERRLQTALV